MLDGFSLFMLFVVSLVGLAICLFSIDYMDHYGSKANFYALFLVMIAGMNGLLLVTDLFRSPFQGRGHRLLRSRRLRT
jgi:multicomponent Na+:H+ antiporter subunit D